jgi:hypothetical protein
MTLQKFETLGVRAIGWQQVIDTIYLSMKDVLQVGSTGNDVASGMACAMHCDHVRGREVSENLDEHFCRKIEKGSCGNDLILRCGFVFVLTNEMS